MKDKDPLAGYLKKKLETHLPILAPENKNRTWVEKGRMTQAWGEEKKRWRINTTYHIT